jgi:hypothetical protein
MSLVMDLTLALFDKGIHFMNNIYIYKQSSHNLEDLIDQIQSYLI